MNEKLIQTAKELMGVGKGIIAADESAGTCEKRFTAVNVPCTEENRRAYREVLLGAPEVEQYVSGVILFDETIRQKTADGIPFPELLMKKGIIPGIKVDGGVKELALHPGEKITEGLDGLRERLLEYVKLGARFAKWRAVITIAEGDNRGMPSVACIHTNAHALARYATLCQEAGIVPIIEPEVLIDGDHTIEQSYQATAAILKKTFEEAKDQDVLLEGMILKASMVIAGKSAARQSTPEEVAAQTTKCLLENVPHNLAGIVFLSGGQSDEQATANLNAMNKIEGLPWKLTFSYSRAIQNPVLKIWAQNTSSDENTAKARTALLFRTKMNSLASQGKYMDEMESERPY